MRALPPNKRVRCSAMHATVRRYEGVDQKRADELTKKIGESLMPRLSKLPGFSDYYLIKSENDVFSSVGVFETPAQADVSNTPTELRTSFSDLIR